MVKNSSVGVEGRSRKEQDWKDFQSSRAGKVDSRFEMIIQLFTVKME